MDQRGEDLQATERVATTLKQERNDALKDLGSLQERLSASELRLSALQQERDDLSQRLSSKTQQITELKSAQQSLSDLEQKASALQVERDELSGQLSLLRKEKEATAMAGQGLSEQLLVANKTIEHLQADYRSLQQDKDRMTVETAANKQEMHDQLSATQQELQHA